jgi:hypothetical protein
LVAIDGWNINVRPTTSPSAAVALNENAQVTHWPVTNLPVVASTYVFYLPAANQFKINCGNFDDANDFQGDSNYVGGNTGGGGRDSAIVLPASHSGPLAMYQSERWGPSTYKFAMKPLPVGKTYTIRLHFVETTYNEPGRRKFNAKINGQQVLTDFDPLKEAGGKYVAIVKEFTGITPDNEGNIVIDFETGSADLPEINGIEIAVKNP